VYLRLVRGAYPPLRGRSGATLRATLVDHPSTGDLIDLRDAAALLPTEYLIFTVLSSHWMGSGWAGTDAARDRRANRCNAALRGARSP